MKALVSSLPTLRSGALLALLGIGLASCGFGTAAIAALTGGDDNGNSPNTPPFLTSGLSVEMAEESPAKIHFEIADREGDDAIMEFFFRPEGGQEIAIEALSGRFKTSATGLPHPLEWYFSGEPQLATGLTKAVTVIARVRGAREEWTTTVDIGNDAPVVRVTEPTTASPPKPLAEVSGISPFHLAVSDSSGHPVRISVQYQVPPDTRWRNARPGGARAGEPTPVYAIQNLETSSTEGVEIETTFFWNTDFDLNDEECDVTLRFRPEDDFDEAPEWSEVRVHVDNNDVPSVRIDETAFVLHHDRRRGVPVPYTVIDEEENPVRVVFQWCREGDEFVELGTGDPSALLADPLEIQKRRICTPYPHFAHGRAFPVDASHVRLPELKGSASWIFSNGSEEDKPELDGSVGLELQLLRSGAEPRELVWAMNPLRAPVAALPLRDGTAAVVLDAVAGAARVTEFDLATGSELGMGVLLSGEPKALASEAGGRSVLVATEDSGGWMLHRVDLDTRLAELLISEDSVPQPPQLTGLIRGVASLSEHTALVTVEDGLWRLAWCDSPRATLVVGNLSHPEGVVVDPVRAGRVWLAERGGPTGSGDPGRVVSIDLHTRAIEPTAAPFLRPTAIALDNEKGRLLVLCELTGTNERVLRGLHLGQSPSAVFPLGTGITGAASVAAGPAGLILVARTAPPALFVGAGIEQVRTLESFEPTTGTAKVTQAFVPDVQNGQGWRIRTRDPFFNPARGTLQGTRHVFVWDSGDVPGGGRVLLRAKCYDPESGTDDMTSSAGAVAFGLDVMPDTVKSIDNPQCIAPADLDGDGDLDLVVANGADLLVSLQVSGGFDPPFPAGSLPGPVAVVAADLDGDGRLDLVAVNEDGNGLMTLTQIDPGLGQQAPRFGAPIPVTGSQAAVSVTAADVDGDGDLDLVSGNVNVGSDSLTIFIQDDDGEFVANPPITDPVIIGPVSVAAADLNGDGRLDLVCANQDGNNLALLFQGASGAFDDPPEFRMLTSPVAVAVADLNGDGDLDLVGASQDGLALFFQTGRGQFNPVAEVIETDGSPVGLVVADLDGDGDLDLVTATGVTGLTHLGGVAVVLQTAPGVFDPAVALPLGGFLPAQSVAAADLNGDGLVDVVVGLRIPPMAEQDPVLIFYQNAPGAFGPAMKIPLPPVGSIPRELRSVTAADLDGDGDLDLVSANGIPGDLAMLLQTAPGNIDPFPHPLDIGREAAAVTAADVNGDGRLDLIASGGGGLSPFLPPRLTVIYDPLSFAPDQEHLSTPFPPSLPPLPFGPPAVVAADLDGDGRVDLASANGIQNNVSVFFQDDVEPEAVVRFSARLDYAGMQEPVSLAAADLNGDGLLDLVSANKAGNDLTVLIQNGERGFDLHPQTFAGGGSPVSVAVADLNGDGLLDLVSANPTAPDLTIYFQKPPGGVVDPDFETQPTRLSLPNSGVPVSVAVADLDSDHDLDLVVANESGKNLVPFFQQAPGRFVARPEEGLPLLDDETPGSVIATDVDGDGEVDLVCVTGGAGTVQVFWAGR